MPESPLIAYSLAVDEHNKTDAWSPSGGDGNTAEPISRIWKGRYQIEMELARGGFGVVYIARDQQLLSKPVVIKVLLDQSEASPATPYIQKKFRQEIEALARIDHPGIVGVLDVGETPEGKPFIVMQFVEGVTLRSRIVKGGMPIVAPWTVGLVTYETTMLGAALATVAGLLIELRLPNFRNLPYDETIVDGGVLLAVKCPDQTRTSVQHVVSAAGAVTVKWV